MNFVRAPLSGIQIAATYRLSSPDMADAFVMDPVFDAIGVAAYGVQVHLSREAVRLLARRKSIEGTPPVIDSAGALWIAGVDHKPMGRRE